jgi:outer membrane receptor protein involved in Fe transport
LAAASTSVSAQVARAPTDDREIVITAPADLNERAEAQSVNATEVRSSGAPDLLRALSRSIPGVSLQDAQGNEFEPNLLYRGFTASALQGQPQGLAVYVDGARFNQPFGETVHFDLLPSAAIDRADLFDASPEYGLNALGGALAIATKTGRSAPGMFASVSSTNYGNKEGVLEAGWKGDRASAYFAIEANKDKGWRRYSPSSSVAGFADVGWDGDRAGIHAKLDVADADLTGNGTSPVELLHADYRAVFTRPDDTRDDYFHFSLHPWVRLGPHDRLQITIYAQRYTQNSLNGDMADIASCRADTSLLCLQTGEDTESLLIDSFGTTVPAASRTFYGVLNTSRTRTDAAGTLTQLVDRRDLGGSENVLTVGFSYDASRTRFGSSSELGALTTERQVMGLGPIIAQPDGSIAPVSLVADTSYAGLFASEHLPITSKLAAELGMRWNQAVTTLHDQLGTALNGKHVYRRLNPGLQLNWRASSKVELRAGVSQSNRAPAPAELACASASDPCSLTNFFIADPPLKQVVTTSLELGGRGKIGPLKWIVTAYRSTNANDIQFVASAVRGRAFFQNVGETRRQGIEATLSWNRGPLEARAGYAFTNATFRRPLLVNSPDNPAADANGQIMVQPGDRLPGVPRQRALISADYTGRTWSLGGDVQVASGQYFFGDEANLDRSTAGYVLANLRGSVRLCGPLQLFGEIRNLFDRHYATYGAYSATSQIPIVEAPGASDPRSLTPGAPRTFLLGVKAQL